MTRLVFIYLFLAALLALALRLPHLDQRPMHNDEAVNAVKFGRLWEHGVYRVGDRGDGRNGNHPLVR